MQSHVALLNETNPKLLDSALQELEWLTKSLLLTLKNNLTKFEKLHPWDINKKIHFLNKQKLELSQHAFELWLQKIKMSIEVYPDGQNDSILIYAIHLLLQKLDIHYPHMDEWVLKNFLNRLLNLRIAFLDDTDFENWMIYLTKNKYDEKEPAVLNAPQSEYVLTLAGKYHIQASSFLLFLAQDEKPYRTPESEYILARAFYKIKNEKKINELIIQLKKQWGNHFIAERAIAGLRHLQKKDSYSKKYDMVLNTLLFATLNEAHNEREKRVGDRFLQKQLMICQTAQEISNVVTTYENHPMVRLHRNSFSMLFSDCFFSNSYKNFMRASKQRTLNLLTKPSLLKK